MLPKFGTHRESLGRGLGSFFPTASQNGEGNSSIFFCKLSDLIANATQPRRDFDESALEELAHSIHEKGVLQPIVVRPHPSQVGKYEIIAGERRFRASTKAGLDEIPVILRNTDSQEALELALIENLQRENLNPVEEAKAFEECIERYELTHEALAQKLGKSRSYVANSLRLLKLPELVITLLKEDRLSNGHARALVALEDRALQEEIARKIVDEGLSVRQTEELMRTLKAGKTEKASPEKEKSFTNQDVSANHRWLEDQFRQFFGTKVKLVNQGDKGRLIVEFFSKEDLDRLYALISKAAEGETSPFEERYGEAVSIC